MFHNLVSRESLSDFICNGMVFKADQFGKLSHAHFSSIVFHNAIGAFVSLLLFVACPSAVFFVVSKIIVDPVQRVLIGGAWTHVLQKPFIGSPLFTDRNIPLCVFPRFESLVACSPCSHVHPAAIRSGLLASASGSCLSVSRFCDSYFLSSTLSASSARSSSKGVSRNFGCESAIANTHPFSVSSRSIGLASHNHCPSSELLSGDVFDVGVECGSSILVLSAHALSWVRGSSEGHSAPTGGLCDFRIAELQKYARRIA